VFISLQAKDNMGNRSLNTVLLGALAVLVASTSMAAVTACATTANGSAFSSFGAPDPANGCAEIDKSFTSLTAVSGVITTNDLQLWATGSAPVGNSINPVVSNFDTTGSANTWAVVGISTQNSSFSYQVDANTGGSFSGGTYPSPNAGFIWAMNSITLVPTGTYSALGTGTETVTMTFCLGQNTTAGCAAADLGTITATFASNATPTYACTVGAAASCASATSNVVNSFAFTEVGVNNSINLSQTADGGQTFTLNNIETDWGQFAETPEPTTFLLFGTALAGVGFLRRRKFKRSI
jgi:hypothetical protein